jgi:hypothetical protein
MDILGPLLDFILHVDVHLANFVNEHGSWVYALLFAIIFVETGRRRDAVPARRLAAVRRRHDVRRGADEPAGSRSCC